jgi:hypothetical protein|tara:strand:- start:90 stop:281 length:192 start_codon:yes stop_codon:yes gene_type:complete
MQTIKFLPNNQIKLSNKTYKGYHVGELPPKFAFIYNESKDQEGISSWFNYKGLTYVEKTLLPW